MEISDYLGILRRRLWIVLAVPLLAGLVVAALVFAQAQKYTAVATVAAPALVGGSASNQYSGANGPKAFVANFSAAVTSPVIVNRISKQVGVNSSTILSGLGVAPLGDSSLLRVSYTTTKKKTAAPVAKAAASETIRFLFETQVTLAQQTADAAKQALTQADTDLAKFQADNGLGPTPDRDYTIKAQEISNLQQQQLQNQAAGNVGAAEQLGAAVRAKQVELAALAPKVSTYLGLVERKNTASNQLGTLQQSADQAAAQFRAADPDSVVSLSQTKRISRASDLVQKVAPAIGAGLFLAVGLVLLLELLSRRPKSVLAGAPASAEAAAAGSGAGHVQTAVTPGQLATPSGGAGVPGPDPATLEAAGARPANDRWQTESSGGSALDQDGWSQQPAAMPDDERASRPWSQEPERPAALRNGASWAPAESDGTSDESSQQPASTWS